MKIEYNLQKIAPRVNDILKKELNIDEFHFILCVAIPIENKPPNTLPNENENDSNYAVNYTSTKMSTTAKIDILKGIAELLIKIRGMNG